MNVPIVQLYGVFLNIRTVVTPKHQATNSFTPTNLRLVWENSNNDRFFDIVADSVFEGNHRDYGKCVSLVFLT